MRGHQLQGADRHRAGTRLSVAHPPARAEASYDRDLQPVALRGRDSAARPEARAQERGVGAVRPDQRIRANAVDQLGRNPQILSAYLARRAEEAPRGASREQEEKLEVPRG